MPLYMSREDRQVLTIPDASDGFWGSSIAQVPLEELNAGGLVANMSHEALAF